MLLIIYLFFTSHWVFLCQSSFIQWSFAIEYSEKQHTSWEYLFSPTVCHHIYWSSTSLKLRVGLLSADEVEYWVVNKLLLFEQMSKVTVNNLLKANCLNAKTASMYNRSELQLRSREIVCVNVECSLEVQRFVYWKPFWSLSNKWLQEFSVLFLNSKWNFRNFLRIFWNKFESSRNFSLILYFFTTKSDSLLFRKNKSEIGWNQLWNQLKLT